MNIPMMNLILNLNLKIKMTKSLLLAVASVFIVSLSANLQAEEAPLVPSEGKNASSLVSVSPSSTVSSTALAQPEGKNPAAKETLERSSEVDELCKNLVRPGDVSRRDADNDKNSLPHPLFKAYELPANITHFMLYFSANWCPPCKKFTPELISFYQENKFNEKGVALIFISGDNNQEAMCRYMLQKKMPWPALAYDKRSISLINRLNISSLPGIVLIDAQGNVIASTEGSSGSQNSDSYTDPRVIMQKVLELPGFQQP